jgi:hypothetical protein
MGFFLGMEIFFLLVCFILVCPFGMCIKDKSHTIRMAKKLLLINDELTKCLSELSHMKVYTASSKDKINSDPKLMALESELFGNMTASERQQSRLGAAFSVEGQSDTPSYFTVYDGDFTAQDLKDLGALQSCLKGGMYGSEGKQTDVSFHREEHIVNHNSNTYTLILHKTRNRKDELKVCSISVFQEDKLMAYLFTTNDPLAFDNFNCFNGCATPDQKPQLKSVEQLVFCEGKAAMNLQMVKPMDPKQFYTEVKNNAFFNKDSVLKVLNTTGNNPLHVEIHKNVYDSLETSIPKEDETKPRKLKAKLLELFEAHFAGDYATRFHTAYITYFEGKLQQDHDLIPFDHYKSVGRDVCAVGDYLKLFEKVSLTYVLSSRMHQLQISQHERSLVSALVSSCVIECSNEDAIWAYKLDQKDNKYDLTSLVNKKNWGRMFDIIADATAFQKAFIEELSHHIQRQNYEQAMGMLFYTDNEMKAFRAKHSITASLPVDDNAHRLGLSERILQSLWTKQIIFPKELITMIAREQEKHGLTYVHYVPVLCKSSHKAIDIARSIGHTV